MIDKDILHYKVLEKLGEGGMGIVYLAEDSKLKRQVAIKFLPPHIATNSDEKERFQIEAQAAASLNHPNIATIHAIETAGAETFIVMEYIRGQELKNSVLSKDGQRLPLEKTLDYALQIARGLQAAHEKGIIHRDIKSSNVMVAESGELKIMDFGLAKVQGGTLVTKAGTTLGTAAYMSPEQARGEEADAGADIWAFGVLLYEMLAGELPFQASHEPALMYEIVHSAPPLLTEINPEVDNDLQGIVLKCLEKEKNQRYQTMRSVIDALHEYKQKADLTGPGNKPVINEPTGARTAGKKAVLWLGIWGLLIIVATLIFYILFQPSEMQQSNKIINRLTSLPGLEDEPTWSPDSKYLAYTADDKGNLDIMVKPLGGGRPIRVVDSDADDSQPAWSPDGSKLAFVSARDRGGHLSIALGIGPVQDFITGKYGDIFLIPALGGTPVKLAEDGYYPAWSPDGKNIVYQSPRNGQWNLWKINTEGGTPVQLTDDNDFDFHPSWSPDGRWIVYGSGDVPVYNLKVIAASGNEGPFWLTDSRQIVVRPVWTADGASIIYSSDRNGSYNLWKIPFALNDKGTYETPRQVTVGIGADINVNVSGTNNKLAYSTIQVSQNIAELNILSGKTRLLTSETSNQDFPRAAPDGRTLIITSNRSGNIGLWTIDLDGNILEQLSAVDVIEDSPSWSPDGRQIAYIHTSLKEKQGYLYKRTLGSLSPVELDRAEQGIEFPIWSPDGKFIAYHRLDNGKINVWIYDLESGQRRQLTDLELNTAFPTWSPDGQFITFQALHGSIRNVWIIPFAGGEARQITFGNEEHSHPQWSPLDMDLILYVLNHKNICTVSVSSGEIKQLTNNVASDLVLDYPSWSPDGKKVYFSISRKTGDIYSLENF